MTSESIEEQAPEGQKPTEQNKKQSKGKNKEPGKGQALPTSASSDADRDPAASTSPPWSMMTKAIVAFFAVVLMGIFFWTFRSLLQPVIFAAILAYLLLPLISFLQRRFHWTRGWSIFAVYLVTILVGLFLTLTLGLMVIEQVTRLINVLPQIIETAINNATTWTQSLSGRTVELGFITFTLPQISLAETIANGRVQIIRWTEVIITGSGRLVLGLAGNIFSGAGTAFVILTISVYLARDFPRIGHMIVDLGDETGYRDDTQRLVTQFVQIWNSYLRGQVTLALVIGAIVTVGLWLMGIRNALALGVLAGLLEFIPIAGPVISAGISTGIAFFLGSTAFPGLSPWMVAAMVLIFMIIVQQVENAVLVPRIVGNALELHPIIIILAVMLGGSLAGILGAVLAAPVTATIKLFGSYFWRKMLDLPPFSDDQQEITDNGSA
ncbi:MAG: AI-2E family transporter [Caldilineaceae bacterium]|nr:AI-2E family transporter [Caldilineaceae bacterium]